MALNMSNSEGVKYYDQLKNSYNTQAQAVAKEQKAQVETDTKNQLQQAYVQRMKDQQTLNNNLLNAGIRGGGTETANLNLANQYNTNRNTVLGNQATSLREIDNTTQENIFNYGNQMDTAKAEYQQGLIASYYEAKYSAVRSLSKLKGYLDKAKTPEEYQAIANRINVINTVKRKY